MNRRDDIQMLIPETHRDLIEAVPRGFPKSAVIAALLMGAMAGSLWTYIVPQWLAVSLLAVLFAVFLIYKRRSDKFFDERLAALETRGLRWETSRES
jgi:Mg2+/citrate symporter